MAEKLIGDVEEHADLRGVRIEYVFRDRAVMQLVALCAELYDIIDQLTAAAQPERGPRLEVIRMKPPIPYYGGKGTMAGWLAGLLPDHGVYIEPFAGSLAVLLAKRPAPIEVVNDLDGWIVAFWRVLRDQPEELERLCALTPYARDEYAAAVDDEDLDDLERARRFWARITQSFNAVPKTSGWRFSWQQHSSVTRTSLSQLGRFSAVASRLREVAIDNRDAVDLLHTVGRVPEAVVYLDPPYVRSTRGDGGGRFAAYLQEMDDDAHRRLATAVADHPGLVIVSGYTSALYDELYDGWWTTTRSRTKRAYNNAGGRGSATEVVWANRDLTREARLEGIA